MIFHCLLSLMLCKMLRDKPVMALAAADAAAISFDYTRTAQHLHEFDWHESNPLAKPFVNHSAIMVVGGLAEVATASYVGERMRQSSHPLVRKLWWVPQVADMGAHVGAALISRPKKH